MVVDFFGLNEGDVYLYFSCQNQSHSNDELNGLAILSRSTDDGDLVKRLPHWHQDAKTCQETSHRQTSLRQKNITYPLQEKKYREIICENFITLVVMNGWVSA